jgi:dehydrogenase/reductase SDR family member 1
MVPRKQGLIVNISSIGGTRYLFNPAYGIGKCAVDRMAVDCGIELKSHNVAMLSLYVSQYIQIKNKKEKKQHC